ncbi:MAG TPA: hypothetical protein VK968_15870, partial [Roseimicrobium sp.]|nr:hypothetical protein [Roseimicrobium sp.]
MNAQEQEQPQSATSLIPVKNRRQAMDWSLALASQGVEATILHDEPSDRWVLAVQPGELDRSLSTLKAYHTETRSWRWQQEVHSTGILFHWAGVCAAFQLVLLHFLVIGYFPHWTKVGVMNGAAFRHGEWWRAVTATTLHADLAHLVSNVTTGAIL